MGFFNRGADGSKVVMNLLTEQHSKIQDIQIEIEKLKTHIHSLRGLINRRFGGESIDANNLEKPKEEKSENNKSDVIVPV